MTKDKLSAESIDKAKQWLIEVGGHPSDSQIIKDSSIPRWLASYSKEQVESACKEQREICSNTYYKESINKEGTWWIKIKEEIRNAPSPK